MEKKLSIEDIALFETEKTVGTPRSLEACKREGITPKDLIYKPLEYFKQTDLVPEIQSLYYEYFENKRKQLIESVKNTRKNIIDDQKSTKSRASSIIEEEMKISQHLEKTRNKNAKHISKILTTEAVVKREMDLRHQEHIEQFIRNQEKIKEKANKSREMLEIQRIKDMEKQKALSEKLKQDKKLLAEKCKNESQYKSLENYIEEQKQKEREFIRQQKKKKYQEHLEKVEEHLAKIKEEREKKIKEKDLKEQKRQVKLRDEVKTARIKIRAKSQKLEQKRIYLMMRVEEEMLKKKEYYEMKMNEEWNKSAQFLESQNQKIKEKYKAMSQERLRRTTMAWTVSEEIIDKKRLKIKTKNEELLKRKEEIEELQKQNAEIRKHKNLLKQFNKEWNIMRERKKKEYEEKQIRKKIEEENKRVEGLMNMRKKMFELRKSVSQQEVSQKEKIQEAFYQMSVSKKWNRNSLTRALNSTNEYDSAYSALADEN